MKKSALIFALVLSFAAGAQAQNWSTVTATNITDLNQQKLAAGQLCFLATDQNDSPINFMVGGGGMVLKRQFCSGVSNGAVTAFTVPNPALTSPTGVYYRVTVIDSATGQEVLRYSRAEPAPQARAWRSRTIAISALTLHRAAEQTTLPSPGRNGPT